MKLTCAEPACPRAIVRQREGQWWCSWHPGQTAPNIDLVSGKIRDPKDPRKEAPRVPATLPKKQAYRAPGVVVEKPRTVRTPKPQPDAPTDGLCLREDCTRTWKHRGAHGHPKPAAAPRPPRQPKVETPAPDDGLCLTPDCQRPYRHSGTHTQPKAPRTPREPITLGPCPTEGCRRLWPHTGKHATKTPALPARRPLATIDAADAARRYLEGARLYDLSAELGIGVKRLRGLLEAQGITIRARGQVIDSRSRATGKPLDTNALELLYAAGNDTREVARHLGVKNTRVVEHLRQAGLLRPASNARAAGYSDLRLRLEPGIYEAIQQHMTSVGHQYVTHYVQELILADLHCNGAWPSPQEATT